VVCAARAVPQRALALLPGLIDACRESAGGAPGRTLARRLTTWLGNLGVPADGLAFGTVAATAEDGLAVFLFGDARLLIPELGIALSGTDGAAWTDRLLARPNAPLLLTTAGAPVAMDAAAGLFDLRAGVVPGAGAVLLHLEAPLPVGGLAPGRPSAPVGSGATPAVAGRDSGSSNGTFLSTGNGWRQLIPREAVLLSPGVRIRLGDSVSFVFRSPSLSGSPRGSSPD